MSFINFCRLCTNTCNDYKQLYDKNGHCLGNLYEIAVKYFHPMFLTYKGEHHVTALCLECWHLIVDFNNFQQRILRTHAGLQHKRKREDSSGIHDNTPKKLALMEKQAPLNESQILIEKFVRLENDSMDNIINSNPNNANKTEYSILNNEVNTLSIESQINVMIKDEPFENLLYPNVEIKEEPNGDLAILNIAFKEELPKISNCYNYPGKIYNYKQENMELSQWNHNLQNQIPTSIGNANFTTDLTKSSSEAPIIVRKHELKEEERNEIIALWRPNLNCPLCQLPFQNYDFLTYHFSQNHPGQKSYIECCGRAFKIRSSIAEHAQYHINPASYKCEICNNCFRYKQSLDRHIATKHA